MLATPGAAPAEIPRQESTPSVFVGVEVGRLTPVFGTAVPPRGLSGLVRRAAYKIPEHKGKRWMLLMLADRIDVQESRLRRHPLIASALLVTGLVGALSWRR
jgi:hypothetical protein